MFRRISRTLALLLAVMAAALVVGVSPAHAGVGGYPPPEPEDCAVSVDDETPEPGQTITITGENWTPGTTATVLVGGEEVGTVEVEDDGTWTFEYTIPDDSDGDYAVSADGCEGAEVAGTTITVDAEVIAADLPRTGSSTTEPLVRTGAVLIAAGAVLVYAVRRRQQAASS